MELQKQKQKQNKKTKTYRCNNPVVLDIYFVHIAIYFSTKQ